MTEANLGRVRPAIEVYEDTPESYRLRLFDGKNEIITPNLRGGSGGIGYTSNLLSATIPMAAANMVVLVFDNFVKTTDAAGFSVSGISDTLEFVDQPDVRTIRLRLSTKVFTQNEAYTISYDPAVGNVLQYDNTPIAAINNFSIGNYSDYSPAEFVSAQIPQAEPSTLVLIMSRAISITNFSFVSGFTLSGTTAQITEVVSDGATIEFSLDEPVDHSDIESDIKLSFDGTGAIDDEGQAIEPFVNRAVTNNSTHTAITVLEAEVPSSDSRSLIMVMEGAVVMPTAAGFSLSSIDQSDLPDLSQASYSVSDGTITFTLSASLLAGKTFTVDYDGTGTLRAASTNDTIHAFSQEVENNSTDSGGIPQGSVARDLGIVVLGHAPTNPQESRQILETIFNTVNNGMAANFTDSNGNELGDYFWPDLSPQYPFVVQAGHDTGGAINLTSNVDLGANGKHICFQVCSKNGHLGKNGVDYEHVWIDFKNIPGYNDTTYADGHYMNPTNTNVGGYDLSKGRAYVTGPFQAGVEALLGITFATTSWIAAVPRRVSQGGNPSPGYDLIQDKLVVFTEYEVHGVNSISDSTQEAPAYQGRIGYYNSNARRIKRDKNNTARAYWNASPYSGNANSFCGVNTSGGAYISDASYVRGFAPAFCVRKLTHI